MADTGANSTMATQSIAQRQAASERRVKRVSVLYLSAFALLTVVNIVFATMWLRSKQLAEKTIVQLADSRAELDSANRSLMNFRTSDSIREARYKAALQKADIGAANKVEQLSSLSATIYLQYIDSYRGDMEAAIAALRASGYKPQPPELMKRANFSSAVKYFREEDKAKADEIASIINRKLSKAADQPIGIVEQKLPAPPGQIEIWLGEPQKTNVQDIIQSEAGKPAKAD